LLLELALWLSVGFGPMMHGLPNYSTCCRNQGLNFLDGSGPAF
jgi:hypothetical protein